MLGKLRATLDSNTLRGRFLKSTGILTSAAGIERAARLGRNIILVRVLAPEEFGLMAMILAAKMAFFVFTQVGVQQCIIQNKRGAEKEFLNAAWWFSTALGIIVFIPAFISAPFVADFYNQPTLSLMLQVACLTILFESMVSPRLYILEKELKFRRWVIIVQGAGLVNIIVAIVLSFYLRNVWALVIALFVESLFKMIFSFLLCPFVPRLKFERQSTSEIYNFAKGIFGLPILMMIFHQADVFFLGKLYPMDEVGKYALVLMIAQIPYMLYSTAVMRLMIPLFSKLQDDIGRFKENLIRMTMMLCLFGIPFIVFLGMYSKSILSLVYGPIYETAAPVFFVLTIHFFMKIPNSIMASCYIALDKPGVFRNFSIVRTIIVLLLLYPMIKAFGTFGAAISVLAATIAFWAMLLLKLSDLIKIDIQEYLSCFIKGSAVSLLILIPGIMIGLFNTKSNLMNISIGITLCFLTWIILSYTLFYRESSAKAG